MKKKLTALALAAMKPATNAYYVADSQQSGLRVRVAPSGQITWNVAFRISGGGPRSVSLGRCDPQGRDGLDIAAARERAGQIMKAARDGRSLLDEEKASAQAASEALSIDGLIGLYSRHIASPNRRSGPLRTAGDIERRLRRALAAELEKPADALQRGDISRTLDAVSEAHPREAEKRRQVIHAMFAWAMSKGYASANPTAGTPSYGLGAVRDRSLTADELRTLWHWLDAGADGMPADVVAVLRLQILLGARVGEIAGMEADEIGEPDACLVWTLPAGRSKNKRPRATPLIGLALDLVAAARRYRPSGPLFRTLDGARALGSSDIGQALNNRDRPLEHFTTHDLRRSVVSGMDELGIPLDTIAAVVGHQRGTKATQTLVRHYSRPNLDHRVEAALELWSAHLATTFCEAGR